MGKKSKELLEALEKEKEKGVTLEKKISDQMEETANLKVEMSMKDKEIEKYKDQTERLVNDLDESKREIVQLNLAKKSLEASQMSLKAENAAKKVKIAEMHRSFNLLEKNNESLEKKNEALMKSIETLEEMKKENGEFAAKTTNVLKKIDDNSQTLMKSTTEMKKENGEIAAKSMAVLNSINNNQIFETTIRARFTGISNLSTTWVYSPPVTFAGAKWRTFVYKRHDDLGFHLEGKNPEDDKWSCSAFTEYQLISHKSEEIIHRRGDGQKAMVHPTGAWGYSDFISFKDLFDKEKEYVKDDAINVAVVIKAFSSN